MILECLPNVLVPALLEYIEFVFLLNFSHFMDMYSHRPTKKFPLYLL